MDAPRINIALIGAGTIGRLHAENVARHIPGARLAVVADPISGRASALADTFGARASTDAAEALGDRAVDAVIVAGPTHMHAATIVAAAAAGKHVFCEKPIALALEDARAAVDAVDAAGVRLQIGFQRRYDPGYRRLREAIARGDVGTVEMVVSTTRDPSPPGPGYLESCGGMFLDTAIHDFDSVRFLSGEEVVEVFATASTLVTPDRRGPFDIDTAVTTLRLESGALASVTNSLRTGYGYEAGAEVFGSRGKLVAGAPGPGVRHFADGEARAPYPGTYAERFGRAYRDEIADFVRCVAEGSEPACNGDDGVRALAIALAARRSQREGRAVALAEELAGA